MLFKRIAIRNFRRLHQPVDITGLEQGLNVIAGDNEEGKSTILRALRAALFDKHTLSGNAALAFQPYGSQVRPEVELEFQLGGDAYRLAKGFCQRPSADLAGPDGSHSGPAAEDRLKELLGFEHPDRGPADARHHGIWGLLWIEQGTAFAPLIHNDRSQRTLQTTLETEVGDILGGQQGHAILDSVRKAHAAFFTKTGRPRGEYSESQKALADLTDELTHVENSLRAYESKVDKLQHLRDELKRWDSDKIIDLQAQKLQEAEQAVNALASLRSDLSSADSQHRLAMSELNAVQARWQQRQEQIQHLQALGERKERLADQLDETRNELENMEPALKALADAALAAKQSVEVARKKLTLAEAAQTRLTLRRALAENHRRQQAALQSTKTIANAQAEADKVRARPESVAALRELGNQLMRAEALLAAGSPEIRFDLDLEVTRSGAVVAAGTNLPVPEQTRFSLGALGTITVIPGGRDQAQAARHVDELRGKQRELLAQLAADSLADAEKALALRQEQLRIVATHQELLAAHAPEGLRILETEISRQQSELDRLDAAAVDSDDPDMIVRQIHEARTELATAGSAAEQSDDDLLAARSQADAVKTRLIELSTQLASLKDEQQRRQGLLEDARSRETEDALLIAFGAAEKAAKLAERQLQRASEQLAAAEPERLALELDKARDTLERSKRRYSEQQQAARDLQIELQSLGQTGLGERRQELQALREQAQLHADRLEREAQSLRLLHDVLEECARRAGETFLAPVLERVHPYLRLLMPNAELLLDSDLQLSGIRREGIDEPFDGLSIGTREQLAVITRLAFADLLHERGQPVVVVLDDALVYSDTERFQRMQLILRRAAQRYQILVLTCRERDYLDLGAPIIRLADCRDAVAEIA